MCPYGESRKTYLRMLFICLFEDADICRVTWGCKEVSVLSVEEAGTLSSLVLDI